MYIQANGNATNFGGIIEVTDKVQIYSGDSVAVTELIGGSTAAYGSVIYKDRSGQTVNIWEVDYRVSTPASRCMAWYWKDSSGNWYYRMYLTTSGDLYAYSFKTISSVRLKENIRDFDESVLDRLSRIRIRRFRWKGEDREDIGIVADEIAEEFPELVSYGRVPIDITKYDPESDEGTVYAPAGYDLSRLVIYLLKALQELYNDYKQLKREYNTLKSRLAR